MPNYTFAVTHTGSPKSHPTTIDFPDNEAAWEEATTAAGEMLRDLDGKLKPGDKWEMEVRLASGETLYRIRVSSEGPDVEK
jgi:hypothetical protein